jgi:hypothetical protein
LSYLTLKRPVQSFTLRDVWDAIRQSPATRRHALQNEFIDILIKEFRSSRFRAFVKKYISKNTHTHDAVRQILGYLPVDRKDTEEGQRWMSPMSRIMDSRALDFMNVLARKICREFDGRLDFIRSLGIIDAEILLYCIITKCKQPYIHILRAFPMKVQWRIMTAAYEVMMRDLTIDPGMLCVLDQNLYELYLAMENPPMPPSSRFTKKIIQGMTETARAGHIHEIKSKLHNNSLNAVDIPYREYFLIPSHDARVSLLFNIRAAQQTHLSRKQISLMTKMHTHR